MQEGRMTTRTYTMTSTALMTAVTCIPFVAAFMKHLPKEDMDTPLDAEYREAVLRRKKI